MDAIEIESLIENIIENADLPSIVLLITTVVASFSTVFANVQKKLRGNVVELINEAEERYAGQQKAGVHKYDWVEDKMRELVPLPLRPFFSKKAIRKLINTVFGNVKEYARMQAQTPSTDISPAPEYTGGVGEPIMAGWDSQPYNTDFTYEPAYYAANNYDAARTQNREFGDLENNGGVNAHTLQNRRTCCQEPCCCCEQQACRIIRSCPHCGNFRTDQL